MKTDPGFSFSRRSIGAWVLALPLLVLVGCASKPQHMTKAPYLAPPVADATAILQRDALASRTRELVRTGKKPAEARQIAEKEFPAPATDTYADTGQAADYYRWKKQRAAQEKFENDLAKMKRPQ